MIDGHTAFTWRLPELMATHGMRSSTELIPRLARRGIDLSRPQVYRVVHQPPTRMSLTLLAALCDVFSCGIDDLIEVPTVQRHHDPEAEALAEQPATVAGADPASAPSPGRRARQRLLDALATLIDEVGYPNTTVADIVRLARASRRTFYLHFSDREDCLVALLTDTIADMVHQVSVAVDPAAHWQLQVRQAVEAWIASAESRPALAVCRMRDVPGLGAGARALQRDETESFIAMVQALMNTTAPQDGVVESVSRPRAIVLVGGLRELIAITIENGEHLSEITEEAVDAVIALLSSD